MTGPHGQQSVRAAPHVTVPDDCDTDAQEPPVQSLGALRSAVSEDDTGWHCPSAGTVCVALLQLVSEYEVMAPPVQYWPVLGWQPHWQLRVSPARA